MSADFYEILGVSEDADTEAIKRAYRQKARLTHPDVNPHPEALIHFQQLQEAYTVLIDAESRARYDQQRFFPEPDPVTPSYETSQGQSGKAWNPSSRYDPAHLYERTDYNYYRKFITIAGVITLLFATTFLIDFIFTSESSGQKVLSLRNKGLITRKADDLAISIIQTDQDRFEKELKEGELSVGDEVDIRRSLIYGFQQFKRTTDSSYRNARSPAILIYVIAALVYIASLNAIFNHEKPERKFNAGLIALFFSLILLALVLIT